jgi:hypothetical protein
MPLLLANRPHHLVPAFEAPRDRQTVHFPEQPVTAQHEINQEGRQSDGSEQPDTAQHDDNEEERQSDELERRSRSLDVLET